MDGDLEELRDYELHNVVDNHRRIGHGAYGRVIEVNVNGARCAAKEMFTVLSGGYRQRFIEECILMSKLRHPNVVQFLGVHMPARRRQSQLHQSIDGQVAPAILPWLIMEYLPFDLDHLLETRKNIPLSVKVSLLLDITKGLTYLHNNPLCTEIIHRDLTARNVLVTSCLVAKIADFGVARILPAHHTLSVNPGNALYMPPECSAGSNHHYDTKLDIFSFGIIMLFTITQQFPKQILSASYTDPHGRLVARSEVDRRSAYFDIAYQALDSTKPEWSLSKLCHQSLQNEPSLRPTAEVLLSELTQLSRSTSDGLLAKDKLQLIEDVHRWKAGYEAEEQAREVQSRLVEEQRDEIERKNQEIHQLQLGTARCSEGERRQLQDQLTSERNRHQHEISLKDTEINHLKVEKRQLQGQLTAETDQHQLESFQKNADIEELKQRLEEKKQMLERTEQSLAVVKQTNSSLLQVVNLLEQNHQDQSPNRLHDVLDQLQHLTVENQSSRSLVDNQQREMAQLRESLRKKEVESQSEKEELKQALRKREEDYKRVKSYAIRFKDQLEAAKQEVGPGGPGPLLPSLPSSGIKISLDLRHIEEKPSPCGLHSGQCVLYNGKLLFGGGGEARESNDKKRIFAYSLDTRSWSELTPYMFSNFALAVVNGKLLAVGGYNEASARDPYTNHVYEYNEEGRCWDQLPESCNLPTKSVNASAIGYREWLIVAGEGSADLTRVDALDCVKRDRWISLTHLPMPSRNLQSASYVKTGPNPRADEVAVWYMTGVFGLDKKRPTFYVPIKDLLYKRAHWTKIKDPPLQYAGAVTFRGHLLAVGGVDMHSRISKKVHMYFPGTNEWLDVAELKSARFKCACVAVSDSKFFVLSGEESESKYSRRVESYNAPRITVHQ